MDIDKINNVLSASLRDYHEKSGESMRSIARGAGVSCSFIDKISNKHLIRSRNCFSLQKLAKFLCRKGGLQIKYKDLFMG